MLQDTHIHIQDIKNPSAIEAFLAGTLQGGMGRFFNCAITPADWPLVKELAARDPRVIPCFGIHPWFADMTSPGWEETLESYLALPGVLAGEMGLDRARKNIDFEEQKKVFAAQLRCARKFQKPFSVHSVRAWAETIDLIKTHAPGLRFLMHSFNGSVEIAREILALGGYFSLSAKQLGLMPDDMRALLLALPLERILVETDFPYQIKHTAPEDYVRAVKEAYCALARVKEAGEDDVVRQVFANGNRFLLDSASGAA